MSLGNIYQNHESPRFSENFQDDGLFIQQDHLKNNSFVEEIDDEFAKELIKERK